MALEQRQEEAAGARGTWRLLTAYEKFEHAVTLILTGLIALIIALAVWNLALKILTGIVASRDFDPTDNAVFQALFGMIFTVIIALEFKRSLLVVAKRRDSVVQVRTVVLIALLAIVRKLLILDMSVVRIGSGHSGTRWRVLAGSRPGQPRTRGAASPAISGIGTLD